MLEQQECVVVLVFDAGGIVEDGNVGVVHLVITNKHESGGEDSGILVGSRAGSSLANAVEAVVNLIDELVVVDVTSTNNNEVVTVVVGGLEGVQVINREAGKVVSITLNRLTQHVVTVGVEVSVFKSSSLHVHVVSSVISGDFLLKDLELSSIKSGVGEGVSEKADSAGDVVLEDGHTNAGLFTTGFTVKASTEGLNFVVEVSSGVSGGATGEHVTEDVGGT